MKLLKASLFMFAVLVASIAAISSSHASKSTSRLVTSPVWLKYDCAEGTVSVPAPIIAPQNYVTSDAQAISLCPEDVVIVCTRKFEVTDPAVLPVVQKPLNYDPITDTYSFNANYPGGLAAAQQAFLDERKCAEQ